MELEGRPVQLDFSRLDFLEHEFDGGLESRNRSNAGGISLSRRLLWLLRCDHAGIQQGQARVDRRTDDGILAALGFPLH